MTGFEKEVSINPGSVSNNFGREFWIESIKVGPYLLIKSSQADYDQQFSIWILIDSRIP